MLGTAGDDVDDWSVVPAARGGGAPAVIEVRMVLAPAARRRCCARREGR